MSRYILLSAFFERSDLNDISEINPVSAPVSLPVNDFEPMFTVTVLVAKLISFDTCVTGADIPSPFTFDTADATSLSTAISSLPITILPVPLYTLNEQFTRFVPSLSLIVYVNVCPPSAPTYKSKLTFALLPIAGFNFNDKVPGAVTFALNLIF